MTNDPSAPRRRRGRTGRPARPGELLGIDARHPIEALRAMDARAKPNLKRAVPAVLIALASFGFGDHLGGIDQTRPARFALVGHQLDLSKNQVSLLVLGLVVVFVLAGFVATRSVAGELARVSEQRAGVAASSAIRLICRIIGYGTVLLGLLDLLRVDLGNLLVGGAVTGVVIGIAAQQTLGNFFAGLVLLFARPYVPGQRVKVRTGAMGGPFEGVILGAGLMYTSIDTDEGVVSMPNAGLLAAAIGPVPEPDEPGGSLLG
ncbi:MAG: mechanosensitive ion channel domain-containing protein [Jatrophihabitans sp.]